MGYKLLSMLCILSMLSLSSCRNMEELIYMRETADLQTIQSLSESLTEYIIKPGDILYVSIKSMNAEVNALFNPESSMEMSTTNTFQKYTTPQGAYLYGIEVDKNGHIHLPILGEIEVANNRQSQIETIVQKRADEFLKESIVKVKLLNYKVTILGEVKNPGVYYNYNNNFTILEALAMANGNSDYANIRKVMVIRHNPEGELAMRLDLSDKDAWKSQGFYLHPNDYVLVEPAKNKNLQLNSQAYSMVLSSLSVLLAVLGFVIK